MRRQFHAALIAFALTVLPAAGQSPSESSGRIAELQEWMAVVAQHTPGRVDQAVETLRSWNRESLQNVRDDLAAIRLLLCERCAKPAQDNESKTELIKVNGQQTWRAVYASDHISALREFIKRSGPQFDINDLLKRGALAHTDIALRAPPILTWASNNDYQPLQRTVIIVVDGQQAGIEATVDHLDLARRLIELVTPDPRTDLRATPGRDRTVRVWYRATMAALIDRRQLDASHMRAALDLLPEDSSVLFLAAVHHETLASTRYQRGVTTRRFANVQVIQTEQQELRRAEELFRHSLKIDPEYVEARLRLGQVIGRLGRHAEALAELRAALAGSSDATLSYYAELLIGREEDALGNVMDARLAYERAARLFPQAQAPMLALSEIEARAGNRAAAVKQLDGVFAARASNAGPRDPWTVYAQTAGRTGNALLTSIGAAFAPAGGRR